MSETSTKKERAIRRARERSQRNQAGGRSSGPWQKRRKPTEWERTLSFAKKQRAAEFRAIEEERQRRLANVNKWAAEERLKIKRKYARSTGEAAKDEETLRLLLEAKAKLAGEEAA